MSVNLALAFGHHHFGELTDGAAAAQAKSQTDPASIAPASPSDADHPTDTRLAHACVICATALIAAIAATPPVEVGNADYRSVTSVSPMDVIQPSLRKAAFQSRAPPAA